MRRIAVWNTAFLGDAVLSLPLLQSLRLRYPEAAIDFYVRKGFEGLFSHHPAISAVHAFDKRQSQRGFAALLRFGHTLAARCYDLWISAHTSPRSACLALASRAPIRIGYSAPALNRLFFSHVVDRRFAHLEEIERLLELLHPLGGGPVSTWPELTLSQSERAEADAFFSSLPEPVLGLHPGSVWATKRWPANFFAAIGQKALASGARVLLFAGPGEEEVAHSVHRQILAGCGEAEAAGLHDLSGLLTLPVLAACLGRLSCYVTNDSGPMHLAWIQRIPVVAIFGPTVRSLGFFPRGKGSTVVEGNAACRPCGLHGSRTCPLKHHQCMTDVTPELVWPRVRERLWPPENC